jgi:hypothetical protein
VQWVTTQPVKYINLAELKGPAGGQLTGYYPDPDIIDAPELEFPVLRNPLSLADYSQRLSSTKWVTDKFASSGVLGQITSGPGILLNPDPLAGDSTISLRPIPVDPSGTFGSASSTPVIEVDVYGRIIVSGSAAIPPINSPTFTGIPAAPTPGPSTNTTQLATTAFVQTVLTIALGAYAPLNSPNFTGTPTAPTAPNGPSSQITNATWVWTYFLPLVGGTLSGPLLISDAAGLTPLLLSANVNDTVLFGITNLSTGASAQVMHRMNSGGRIADRRVNYTGQFLHDVGSVGGITSYFADFDNHSWRTLAGVAKLALSTTLATLSLPLTSTGRATILNATAVPAGGTQGSGYLLSSVANFGVIFGSGAPTASMARGSLYLRSDGPPYYNTDGATTWSPVGGNVTTSDTPPVAPLVGQLWWNSVLGDLYINYNDGNTTQWVPASPKPNPNLTQCAFNVRTTTNNVLSGPGSINLFRSNATPVKDYDPAGVWDNVTAFGFTAPSNGRYHFHCQAYLQAGSNVQTGVYMNHRTAGGVVIRSYAGLQMDDTSGYGTQAVIDYDLQMVAGEKVDFFQSVGTAVTITAIPSGGAIAANLTFVCGHRIGD